MANVQFGMQKAHSPGQKELIISPTMDVVFAGRRWGKTHSGTQRIIRGCIKRPGLYWWVGLGWKSASLKRAWRELKGFTQAAWTAIDEKPDSHIRESAKELDIPGGSEIWMRTAEREDSLAGEGIMGAVVDEFTLMKETVWTEYLEATLLDKNGWGMFIGVPKGNNWGARLWRNAKTREGWRQWHFPTSSNPIIDLHRLEDIRRNTPELLFQQEYLAKIVDGAGLVFTNFMECATSTPLQRGLPRRNYVFGLDWGKNADFTCVAIFDITEQRMVHLARFNEIDYPSQLEKVRALHKIFPARCIVAENNAMGEPLIDQLIKDGLPMKRFHTTNASKREVIESLQVAFEQKYIAILNHKDLITELEEYESNVTSHGNVTYSAPEGGHDDCVMAAALGWYEIKHDIGITL